jgi:hypothetical protein
MSNLAKNIKSNINITNQTTVLKVETTNQHSKGNCLGISKKPVLTCVRAIKSPTQSMLLDKIVFCPHG